MSTPSGSVMPNVTRAGAPAGNTEESENETSVKGGRGLVVVVVGVAVFPLLHAVTNAALAPPTKNERRLQLLEGIRSNLSSLQWRLTVRWRSASTDAMSSSTT